MPDRLHLANVRRPPGPVTLVPLLARRLNVKMLVPRANEQAAGMAAVINLARAVAVVWLLLLR